MVDRKIIVDQLRRLKFGTGLLNQGELRELPDIIHEGEEISELANGWYEGGVALLIATDERMLLVDKKPFNFLRVEDLRFDMINEIDYNHRLMGASITISTGSKTLRFNSFDQRRLRHLISLVQSHMSSSKKQQSESADTQQQHLEAINQQLQQYLIAQHQHLQQQLSKSEQTDFALPKPNAELADYLFAQQLLEQYKRDGGVLPSQQPAPNPVVQAEQIAQDARNEIFGRVYNQSAVTPLRVNTDNPAQPFTGLEVNPLRIAYSRLPMMLRNRKFGRPLLHGSAGQTSSQQSAITTY